jgi:predicted hydrocarbon binding protein
VPMSFFHISPDSIRRLRQRLDAHDPSLAATLLHDAGFATGEAMAAAWSGRIKERTGLADPGRLDHRWFDTLFAELSRDLGWGSPSLTELGDEALLIESEDWAESVEASSPHPACHFTAGALAAFLSALAGGPIAVLEVECRSAGKSRCAFVAGSPAMISATWDLVVAGGDWRDGFAATRTA